MNQAYSNPHPGLSWRECTGQNSIPQDAVQGGMEENGDPLFIARCMHEGSLIPGKTGRHIKGILISYGGKEIIIERGEVLCGDARIVKWKECVGQLQVSGWYPLKCGYERDGRELYTCKTRLGSGEVLGKVGTHMSEGMVYGYDCKEKSVKSSDKYYVLSLPNQ